MRPQALKQSQQRRRQQTPDHVHHTSFASARQIEVSARPEELQLHQGSAVTSKAPMFHRHQ